VNHLSPRLAAGAVVASGAIAVIALSIQAAMSTGDALQLALIAAGVALVGLVAGATVLRALARRSIASQTIALIVTTIAALGLGVYVAARRMFISHHDLGALAVVLVAAGTVGVASALVLGSRVGRAVDALARATRDIDLDEGVSVATATPPAALELVRLGDELRSMERRLAQASTRERVLETSRRELVAAVSHDLRTPLAGMRAILEALEDEIVDDEATKQRYLHTLHDEVRRLSSLVDDLFELSRAESGALSLRLERVALTDLVSDALAGFAPVAAAKRVRLVGTVVGEPPAVSVSPPEVLRALRNLLENAIRHTPSDGSVAVEVGVDVDHPSVAFVSVRDTGGGVAEQDLPRVFDVAFQGDPARRSGAGGLGLAIAKRFVEAHDGELVARNEGDGARFTVRLPCAPR
jgi:signal transduction histidine kinase